MHSMPTPLQIDIITIFPEMLEGFIASMLKRAAQMQACVLQPGQPARLHQRPASHR